MVDMTDIPQKRTRSDKGKKRVIHSKPPRVISIQLDYDDPVQKGILDALDKDLKIEMRTDVRATKKTILVRWLAEYLGLK